MIVITQLMITEYCQTLTLDPLYSATACHVMPSIACCISSTTLDHCLTTTEMAGADCGLKAAMLEVVGGLLSPDTGLRAQAEHQVVVSLHGERCSST